MEIASTPLRRTMSTPHHLYCTPQSVHDEYNLASGYLVDETERMDRSHTMPCLLDPESLMPSSTGMDTPSTSGLLTPSSSCSSISSYLPYMTPTTPVNAMQMQSELPMGVKLDFTHGGHLSHYHQPQHHHSSLAGTNPFYSPTAWPAQAPSLSPSPSMEQNPTESSGASQSGSTVTSAVTSPLGSTLPPSPVLTAADRAYVAQLDFNPPEVSKSRAQQAAVYALNSACGHVPQTQLSAHLTSSPPGSRRRMPGRPPKPLETKPHCCGSCGKAFRRLEHLKRHAKVHTEERPFQCDVAGCERRFSRSDNLRAHRRTHTKRGGRNTFVEGLNV